MDECKNIDLHEYVCIHLQKEKQNSDWTTDANKINKSGYPEAIA